MSNKFYTIFLIKMKGCHYCEIFKPIFDEASENKPKCDKKLKYISYDIIDGKTYNHSDKKEEPMGNIYKNYNDEIKVEGYPTILLLTESNGKIEKKEEIKERGKDSAHFNEIVLNTIKNLESNGKSEFVLVGENKNYESDDKREFFLNGGGNKNYESKYQKYKLKYLGLKKLLNK